MSGVPDVCTTTYQKLMHDTMARLFNACDMSVSGDDVAPAQSGEALLYNSKFLTKICANLSHNF